MDPKAPQGGHPTPTAPRDPRGPKGPGQGGPREPKGTQGTQGDQRGPEGSQGDPRGPKGAFGALGGDGPMGPFGVIPKPFRMESHSEWKVTPHHSIPPHTILCHLLMSNAKGRLTLSLKHLLHFQSFRQRWAFKVAYVERKRSFKNDLQTPFAFASLNPRSRTPSQECPKHDSQECQKVS